MQFEYVSPTLAPKSTGRAELGFNMAETCGLGLGPLIMSCRTNSVTSRHLPIKR